MTTGRQIDHWTRLNGKCGCIKQHATVYDEACKDIPSVHSLDYGCSLSLVPRLDSPAIVIVMYSGEIEKKTQCKTNSMGKAQHSDQ